jgi:adhesin transport system outer membrane protein
VSVLRKAWLCFALPLLSVSAPVASQDMEAPTSKPEEGVSPPPSPEAVPPSPKDTIGVAAESAAAVESEDARDTAREARPEKGGAVYGPPSPKVDHGKLADIVWPDAPRMIPPALEQAIRIVTHNYPSAKSARAALQAANSEVKAAKWQRFPTVTAGLQNLDRNNTPDPQVSVELPVFTAGRIGAGIRRAKAEEDASSAGYVETVEQLALTTSDTYFQIAQLAEREKLLVDSLAAHNRLVATMERRVKQEISPDADLQLARSRTAQVEQDYNLARSQRLTALRVFAELVADSSYDLGPTPYFDDRWTIDNPDALEEQAVAFDPKLRRLNAQIDVARAEYEQAHAAIFPSIGAQYSYDNVFGSRVGVVVRAQAAGGLSLVSSANAARTRIRGAEEDARVADQELRRTVASDLINFNAAKERASISLTASETAAQVSESYMRQFIAGRRTWLDVMNALREAVNAQIGKSDAQVTAMAAAVRLQLRSGRWQPSFPESTAQTQ